MAKLVKCTDCGKKISQKADVCPQCGAPPARVKKGGGGKWLLLIALVPFVYFVLGGPANRHPEELAMVRAARERAASQTTPQSVDPAPTKPEGRRIPRSSVEKANYYLISVEQEGKYKRSTHVRISSVSKGYSVTRIDCATQRYQDLGYGEDSLANMKMYDSVKWTGLLRGSSKTDLVSFVCSA